jgi:hypothetical protein
MTAVMEEHGGLEAYLTNMSKAGRVDKKNTWGDEIALEAAAHLYQRPVTVLSDDVNTPAVTFSYEHGTDSVPIVLGFVNGNHFVSLVAITAIADNAEHLVCIADNAEPLVCIDETGVLESPANNTVTADKKSLYNISVATGNDDNIVCSNSTDTQESLVTIQPQLYKTLPAADIGYCAGSDAPFPLDRLTYSDKVTLLEHHWRPPLTFAMPYCTRKICGKVEKRYLRHEHLDRCKFLAFSERKMGLYCKACVLFGPLNAGRNPTKLQALVTTPLVRYDRLFGADGYITSHEMTQYHKTSVLRASNFATSMANQNDILVQVDTTRSKQIKDNRERLKPIIETVLLCGRQNIPMRGHRDDGAMDCADGKSVVENDGNFRALLRFRVSAGDINLRNHLEQAAKNATYVSKTTQNELITAAGNVVRDQILERVSKAPFFSMLVDETTDLSKKEQITICLRYVFDNFIHEDFIDYVVADSMTGEGLAATILTHLGKFPIELSNMIGQGYDGAAAMSGIFNGVQSVIRRQLPAATYVHCASHCLNLTLASACKQPQMRNAQGIVGEVAAFLNRSAKRVTLMRQCTELIAPEARKNKLVQLCETRWVERHDAIITFVELFPCVLSCLDKCQQLDANTSTKAQMLSHSIRSPDFLVAVAVLESILAVTLSLSKTLQCPSIDLIEAIKQIQDVERLLKMKRDKADTAFVQVWLQATKLANEADVALEIPRQASRQQHRSNTPASDEMEYFRRNHYIPFLDSVLQEFRDRFLGHSEAVCHLSAVVPAHINLYSFNDLLPAFNMYASFVDSESQVRAEFELWKQRWQQVTAIDRPNTAIGTLPICSPDFFPNIRNLLLITATLPVTTATAERSFSSLRLLKNHLRTTMSEDRLAGLTLLYLHKDINVTTDQVLDKFSQQCRRREFIL